MGFKLLSLNIGFKIGFKISIFEWLKKIDLYIFELLSSKIGFKIKKMGGWILNLYFGKMSWPNPHREFSRRFLIQFRAFWHIMGLKRIFLSKVILVSIFGTKKHFIVRHCRHPKSPLGLAVPLLHGYLAISSGGLPFSPATVASPLPRVCKRQFCHCCWRFTWILRSKTTPCWNLF